LRKLKKIFVLFVIFFGLIGCENTTTSTTITYPNKDYSQFAENFISNPEDQLNQEYDEYYLYFYGPTCLSCEYIKNEVLSKIELLSDTMIFFVEASIPADVNSEIAVTHTPSLVKVVNHQVVEIFEGGASLLSEIDTLS